MQLTCLDMLTQPPSLLDQDVVLRSSSVGSHVSEIELGCSHVLAESWDCQVADYREDYGCGSQNAAPRKLRYGIQRRYNDFLFVSINKIVTVGHFQIHAECSRVLIGT